MLPKQTYYQLLNIPVTCSQKQIKVAFKRQIKKYHPDKNQSTFNQNLILNKQFKSENSSDQFKKERSMKIIQAYQFLMDKQKRQKYDKQLHFSTLKQTLRQNRHKDVIQVSNFINQNGNSKKQVNEAQQPQNSKNINDTCGNLDQEKENQQQYQKQQDHIAVLVCQQCFGQTQLPYLVFQQAAKNQVSINCHHCGIYITLI